MIIVGGDVAGQAASRLGDRWIEAGPGPRARDPFGLASIIADLDPSERRGGLMVVAGTRRGAHGAVPAPVIDGVPVGVLFADTLSQLDAWCQAVRSRTEESDDRLVVASMYNPTYEAIADDVVDTLGSKLNTIDVRSRHHSRQGLMAVLGEGPRAALYIGHGRWRGWSGYRGVRWSHVEATGWKRAVGTVISLSCDSLKRPVGKRCFGERFVTSGRAAAWLGSARPLRIDEGFLLCNLVAEELAKRPPTVGDLLSGLWRRAAGSPTAAEVAKLRLVGSPSQPLLAA